MRHGRAVIPFGKYRGCRIRVLPDAYLSWLSGWNVLQNREWKWLHDSLIAELEFRGLRGDLADTPDPEPRATVDVPPLSRVRTIELP
jgi:uncharacterized protein (DUF3820 family)